MGKKETQPLAYRLMSVNTEKFSFSLPHKKYDINAPELINYHVDPKVMFNSTASDIIIRCIVRVSIKETQEIIMELETIFIFNVDQLSDYIETKGTNTEFIDKKNNQFLALLIGVAYSTSRGIVLERCRGTIIEHQIMPVINPMQFIKPIEEIKS